MLAELIFLLHMLIICCKKSKHAMPHISESNAENSDNSARLESTARSGLPVKSFFVYTENTGPSNPPKPVPVSSLIQTLKRVPKPCIPNTPSPISNPVSACNTQTGVVSDQAPATTSDICTFLEWANHQKQLSAHNQTLRTRLLARYPNVGMKCNTNGKLSDPKKSETAVINSQCQSTVKTLINSGCLPDTVCCRTPVMDSESTITIGGSKCNPQTTSAQDATEPDIVIPKKKHKKHHHRHSKTVDDLEVPDMMNTRTVIVPGIPTTVTESITKLLTTTIVNSVTVVPQAPAVIKTVSILPPQITASRSSGIVRLPQLFSKQYNSTIEDIAAKPLPITRTITVTQNLGHPLPTVYYPGSIGPNSEDGAFAFEILNILKDILISENNTQRSAGSYPKPASSEPPRITITTTLPVSTSLDVGNSRSLSTPQMPYSNSGVPNVSVTPEKTLTVKSVVLVTTTIQDSYARGIPASLQRSVTPLAFDDLTDAIVQSQVAKAFSTESYSSRASTTKRTIEMPRPQAPTSTAGNAKPLNITGNTAPFSSEASPSKMMTDLINALNDSNPPSKKVNNLQGSRRVKTEKGGSRHPGFGENALSLLDAADDTIRTRNNSGLSSLWEAIKIKLFKKHGSDTSLSRNASPRAQTYTDSLEHQSENAHEQISSNILLATLIEFINKNNRNQQDIQSILEIIKEAKNSIATTTQSRVSTSSKPTMQTASSERMVTAASVSQQSLSKAATHSFATVRKETLGIPSSAWKTVTIVLESDNISKGYKKVIEAQEKEIMKLQQQIGSKLGNEEDQALEPGKTTRHNEEEHFARPAIEKSAITMDSQDNVASAITRAKAIDGKVNIVSILAVSPQNDSINTSTLPSGDISINGSISISTPPSRSSQYLNEFVSITNPPRTDVVEGTSSRVISAFLTKPSLLASPTQSFSTMPTGSIPQSVSITRFSKTGDASTSEVLHATMTTSVLHAPMSSVANTLSSHASMSSGIAQSTDVAQSPPSTSSNIVRVTLVRTTTVVMSTIGTSKASQSSCTMQGCSKKNLKSAELRLEDRHGEKPKMIEISLPIDELQNIVDHMGTR